MGITLFFSGVLVFFDFSIGIIILTLIYSYAFNIGYGPVLWIYASETLDSYG